MDVPILVLDLLPLEVEPGRKVEAVMEEIAGESKHRVLSPKMSILTVKTRDWLAGFTSEQICTLTTMTMTLTTRKL